ncbi:DNA repair and transcription factor protein [Trypanosoma theileri]|uniref:General transcription factor IIH subunit 4 n=1 Tax=Trypanosoma theileri TaxID=67003 RepID=A0A1X0P966_9TRYP|nr:DNA repair and transcription factor protein [Trypanosoma theileri]ORC93129.1 DNA repair and transcription factor protein [Trypanosoma theileri]
MNPSFLDQLLGFPERETLLMDCPALAVFCFQEFVASMQNGRRVTDPILLDDEVRVLFSITSPAELTEKIFTAPQEGKSTHPFWSALRKSLECAWDPFPESSGNWCLSEVGGNARIYGPSMKRMPLANVSLQNALNTSRSILRMVTACALAGSIDPLGEKRGQPIASMLQYSRLIPPSPEVTGVTSEGLGFCMQSLQQQWWTLVSVALDRVLALTNKKGVTRSELWKLLAILFMLDTSKFVYLFPSKEKDLVAFHLLARLSEVGLVYPLMCNGLRCFVLSPHFHHALSWSTTAPLCTVALLNDEGGPSNRVRREDEDTIITETNFRLYAYTRNRDLLNILDQFAVKEAEVDNMIACYRVTRASFAAALRRGIRALDILRFLAVKAHPSMLKHYHNSNEGSSEELYTNVSNVGNRFLNASDTYIGGVIPQAFCDQLLTWERECRRLVFRHDLVLLRNLSATQREVIVDHLCRSGEGYAVVHQENGYMVVQRDTYNRVLAPLIPTD